MNSRHLKTIELNIMKNQKFKSFNSLNLPKNQKERYSNTLKKELGHSKSNIYNSYEDNRKQNLSERKYY